MTTIDRIMLVALLALLSPTLRMGEKFSKFYFGSIGISIDSKNRMRKNEIIFGKIVIFIFRRKITRKTIKSPSFDCVLCTVIVVSIGCTYCNKNQIDIINSISAIAIRETLFTITVATITTNECLYCWCVDLRFSFCKSNNDVIKCGAREKERHRKKSEREKNAVPFFSIKAQRQQQQKVPIKMCAYFRLTEAIDRLSLNHNIFGNLNYVNFPTIALCVHFSLCCPFDAYESYIYNVRVCVSACNVIIIIIIEWVSIDRKQIKSKKIKNKNKNAKRIE